jgi:hypothetical protein
VRRRPVGTAAPRKFSATPNKEVRAQLEIDEPLHETRYAVVKLNDRTKLFVATLYILKRRRVMKQRILELQYEKSTRISGI